MLHLSTVEEVKDSDLLTLGTTHLEMETPFESAEALRDHLIELISVRNLRHRPEALFALFRQFLQRLTLPRICHFLDLVLPQLTSVRAPWADATRTLWTCHHIRASSHENGYPFQPRVTIAYFFTSHDHIHHVRIFWGTLPLLLFSDPRMVHPVDVNRFQGQAVHRMHQQHIQLGLRKGMAVLVYYRVHENKFSLTPSRIPVERKTPAAKRCADQDMVAKEESVSDAESGWSGVSHNSSTDSECTDVEASSVASDQDRFDTAYDAFRDLALTSDDTPEVSPVRMRLESRYCIKQEKLQELVHLPRTWPLARLTIPLAGLSKQVDRLLEGYCLQILATNRDPESHNGRVLQTATHLTWILEADTIAWLMRSILDHASKILFDNDTQLLLTPKFWILPLYRELLNSARRIRPSPSSERARGCTGLVKGAAVSSEAMEDIDSTDVTYKIRQWSLPGATIVPVLNVSSRVFWLELDDKALLDSYAVLQEGILCDVFSQKCSAAWQGARGERLTVGIMLPGRQDADDWLNFMLSQKNLWPTFTTRGTLTEEFSEQVFSKERRRLQAKHLWMQVKLRWQVLADRMYVKASTGKSKEELDALLFDRAARRNCTDPYEEKSYRGAGIKEVQAWWRKCKDWMARFKDQSEPFVDDFKELLKALSGKEAVAQSEVDAFMENCAKRWQTREGTYQIKRRRLKPDVRDSPEYPSADIDMADI
eukprot:symbB.v1.2.041471.t1/scaffold8251.1/size7089/1